MAALGLDTYQPLLDRFTDTLEQVYGDRLISVVLFGSVARGTANPDSDLDLLVIIDGLPERYGDRLDDILPILKGLRVDPTYDLLISEGIFPSPSVILFTPKEANQHRLLYLDMIEDSVRLFDRQGFFENRLEALRIRLKELGAAKTRQNGDWYWDLKPDLRPGEALVL
jgi:uncharacterized protein